MSVTPVLNLIMLALAVLGIILAFIKKWRLFKIISIVVVAYFGTNIFFFETKPGKNLLYLHPAYWGMKADMTPLEKPLLVDGRLDEQDWELQEHPFYLHEGNGETASEYPSFQILQDKENLYIGGRYDSKSGRAFEAYEQGQVGFGFTLTAFFGNTDKRMRLLFEPLGDGGSLAGRATVDCPKNRYVENYTFASVVDGHTWMFEFSVPLDEIMDEKDMIIVYKLRFFNRQVLGDTLSYFPTSTDKFGKYVIIER